MVDGTEKEDGPPVFENASAVLDDSDYAIPNEWGLKEAYNDD